MEKVQFQLEATLPELKDLHEKGLFTKSEIDQITRKRTAFETSLIRRETRKDDFFKYAEYEINLERLRRVRWKKLNYHINPPPPSASTYSLPRRALYILKRATAKFPGDLAVWLAYVEYASREGMRKIVSKGLNSALQHHPLSSTLYLLLSYHHLHPTSPFPRDAIPSTSSSTLDLSSTSSPTDAGFSLEGTSSARTTILLGLRLLPQSSELWTEYIKLELGWVEALRRRWNVLGIDTQEQGQTDAAGLSGGEGSFGPDGEDARKSILAGQLVIHALNSALDAIKLDEHGLEFRERLIGMLRVYPSALRGKSLEVIYEELGKLDSEIGRTASQAKLLLLTRNLYDRPYEPGHAEGGIVLEGVRLIEEIGGIAKEIRKTGKKGTKDWLEVSGEWLAEQIHSLGSNKDLREYLFSVLSSLTSSKLSPPPSLLLLHLDILPEIDNDPSKVLSTARSHAEKYPSHPSLQLTRLRTEIDQTPDSETSSLRPLFENVVKAVCKPQLEESEELEVRNIWFCWTSFEERNTNERDIDAAWRNILGLSSKLNRPNVHTAVLGRYFISILQRAYPSPPISTIASVAKYRPTEGFHAIAFAAIQVYSNAEEKYRNLSQLYEIWRSAATSVSAKTDAGFSWAEWLLRNGRALEATRVVESVKRADPEVEPRWKHILDTVEATTITKSGVIGEKEVELERLLAEIGFSGLATPDGVLGDDDDVQDEEEDEEEEKQESGGDEDEDMESDEEEEPLE